MRISRRGSQIEQTVPENPRIRGLRGSRTNSGDRREDGIGRAHFWMNGFKPGNKKLETPVVLENK
jgi:hypothetical protein